MADLLLVGPSWGDAGSFKPQTASISGALRTADAHGRYFDQAIAGRMFLLSAAAAAPTAYVGAAGGSPLLAIHNPANSNRYAALSIVGYGARGQVTAAGSTELLVWSGPSVQPTGTVTPPRSVLSQAQGGSSMLGFVNTALTGSTALSLALPLNTFHLIGATPVSESQMPSLYDIGDIIILAPGNQLAIGVSTVPAGLTCDIAMYWSESPFMTQV